MSRALQKQIERSRQAHNGLKRVELILPLAHVERLDALSKSAGITRAQAVSMLLLDKREGE